MDRGNLFPYIIQHTKFLSCCMMLTTKQGEKIMTEQTNLLTTSEAAEYLSLKPQTLHNYRHYSKPPAYIKLGRRIAYKKSDLDDFIRVNRVEL